MGSALATELAARQPREKAGARTGARYAYQAHVSLLKMLDLHEADTDYRALFDYFDDLLLLSDSSNSPACADFFQIKSKGSGVWRAKDLVRAQGTSPKTYVGKMYHHTTLFGAGVGSCRFTSNAAFEFKMAAGNASSPDDISIPFATIGPADQKVLKDGLDLDFPPPRNPDEAGLFVFERSPVPITGYEIFLKGRLVEMLASAEDNAITISGLYRVLIEEITKRANDASTCSNLDDVFQKKSLARQDVEKALGAAETRHGILDHWDVIDGELLAAGRSGKDRIRMQTNVVDYMRARAKNGAPMQTLGPIRTAALGNATALHNCAGVLEAAAKLQSITALPLPTELDPLLVEAAFLVESFDAVVG